MFVGKQQVWMSNQLVRHVKCVYDSVSLPNPNDNDERKLSKRDDDDTIPRQFISLLYIASAFSAQHIFSFLYWCKCK